MCMCSGMDYGQSPGWQNSGTCSGGMNSGGTCSSSSHCPPCPAGSANPGSCGNCYSGGGGSGGGGGFNPKDTVRIRRGPAPQGQIKRRGGKGWTRKKFKHGGEHGGMMRNNIIGGSTPAPRSGGWGSCPCTNCDGPTQVCRRDYFGRCKCEGGASNSYGQTRQKGGRASSRYHGGGFVREYNPNTNMVEEYWRGTMRPHTHNDMSTGADRASKDTYGRTKSVSGHHGGRNLGSIGGQDTLGFGPPCDDDGDCPWPCYCMGGNWCQCPGQGDGGAAPNIPPKRRGGRIRRR